MTIVPSSSNKTSTSVDVEVRNLHKAFGRFDIHKGINLDIYSGSITYIMGGSGVGKSLLLKQIVGFIPPDEGTVKVLGKEVRSHRLEELREIRKSIGILFQHGALFDSMNVFENVAFPLKERLRMSGNPVKERVEELLDSVGLGKEHGSQMPFELSGGQRKRVALARAVALKPKIMMYDEPTTGLDPITKKMVIDLICDSNKRHNLTSIVVSHDTNAARKSAERIAFLKDGVVRYYGKPEGILESKDKELQDFFFMSS